MNAPVYNQRAERAIARLYGERISTMPAAEVLGAALCAASNYASYEEHRNPYLPGDAQFIDFKQGWTAAVSNRAALERAA